MAEDFRHRYDKWSKNNLIIEVERLKRKLREAEEQMMEWMPDSPAAKRALIERAQARELPAHRRNHLEEHELVPKDIGGGITIMVPPGTE